MLMWFGDVVCGFVLIEFCVTYFTGECCVCIWFNGCDLLLGLII